MKKIRYIIIFILILIISLLFFFWPKQAVQRDLFSSPQKERGIFSNSPPRTPQTKEITYTNEGFSPTVLSINAGDTVIFKNKSKKNFQPKSDKNFEAETPIAKYKEYQFTFQTSGEYGYYDQLDQSKFGAVVVK
ncbi:MAG: cupredoxin domain-containing protein [Candidatus Parcubacteria bacterium]|nr:cupredoxin domain-containing protein [Candidatus Parcubacteria bacterium]